MKQFVITRDGQRLIAADTKTIHFYETTNWREVAALPQEQEIERIIIHPDGMRLIVQFEDTRAQLWDVRSIERRRESWARRAGALPAAHAFVDKVLTNDDLNQTIKDAVFNDSQVPLAVRTLAASILIARCDSIDDEIDNAFDALAYTYIYPEDMVEPAKKIENSFTRKIVLDRIAKDKPTSDEIKERVEWLNSDTWELLCNVRLDTQEIATVSENIERMLSVNSDAIYVKESIALFLYRQGKFQEAYDAMKVLMNSPKGVFADDWAAFSIMQAKLGMVGDARKSLSKANDKKNEDTSKELLSEAQTLIDNQSNDENTDLPE
jgi:hypothetical protein